MVTSGHPRAPRTASDLGARRLTPCLKRPSMQPSWYPESLTTMSDHNKTRQRPTRIDRGKRLIPRPATVADTVDDLINEVPSLRTSMGSAAKARQDVRRGSHALISS